MSLNKASRFIGYTSKMQKTTTMNHKINRQNYVLRVEKLAISRVLQKEVKPFVEPMSFSLKKGEIVAIIDESTTRGSVLSLSVSGLLNTRAGYSSTGNIFFYSQLLGKINLQNLKERDLQKILGKEIGFISQNSRGVLNPAYTCGKQVTEVLSIHENIGKKASKKRVVDLLSKLSFDQPEGVFSAYPHQISVEERKLLLIAIALIGNPALIIANEPMQGLHIKVQKRLLEVFCRLKKKQINMLLVSQNIGFIREIADKVIIMYEGNIMEEGNTKEILLHPQHPYTKALLFCSKQMELGTKPLPNMSDFITTDNTGSMTCNSSLTNNICFNTKKYAQTKENTQIHNILQEKQKVLLSVSKLGVARQKKPSFFKVSRPFEEIESISFDIYAKETLGLISDSETKQSNRLVQSMLSLVEPQQGEIIFEGQKLTRGKKEKNIRVICYPSYPYLNPQRSIGDSMNEIMKVHDLGDSDRTRKKISINLLELVQMNSNCLDLFPDEFSADQCLKICIAKSLIVKPKLIIWNGLSLNMRTQAPILNLLQRLKDKYELSYLFISQDLHIIKYVSDRIVLMREGKIEETSTTEDFYNQPQSAYGRSLIEAMY